MCTTAEGLAVSPAVRAMVRAWQQVRANGVAGAASYHWVSYHTSEAKEASKKRKNCNDDHILILMVGHCNSSLVRQMNTCMTICTRGVV